MKNEKCIYFLNHDMVIRILQLDKHDRRIAEKCLSDILLEIEMLADMPTDGELNYQQ